MARIHQMRRTMLVVGGRLQSGFVIGAIGAVGLLLVCAVLFFAVESGANPQVRDLGSGFVWVTRTLLQGEPPYEAVTGLGQFLFYVVVVTGVGLVAIGTGAVATKLIEFIRRRDAGMGEARYSGHIVICGWSPKGEEILRDLHAKEIDDKRPVVILARLEENPSADPLTTFIRGVPSNSADLHRAGIDRADTAIVLADETNPSLTADDIDAKTLLATLAIESINPRCYTCVEVIRPENRQHFQRAKADELVVSAELTGALLASSAVAHGISRAVHDLLSHPGGTEFYCIDAPPEIVGTTFSDALVALKRERDSILVAIARADGHYDINPPADRTISARDRVLVIAERPPVADNR